MFTDIVGFTERTSQQSREENAKMLQAHDRLLLPVVAHYSGRKVKSIGDALLVTFRSPTDAVRCGMALQDATWGYNRDKREPDQLHIRVAINLGEVRKEGGDIFGEPVNIAARLEGTTPAHEVYLTAAVYLAMNKAEVPAEFVRTAAFKGIPEAVDVYRVPLAVSEAWTQPHEGGFPYGGPHEDVDTGISAVQRTLRVAHMMGEHASRRTFAMAPNRLRAWRAAASRHKKTFMASMLVALLLGVAAWVVSRNDLIDQASADLEAERWDAVEQLAHEALKEHPESAEAEVLLGHASCGRGDTNACVTHYGKALTQDADWGDDARLARNLVRTLGRSGGPAVNLIEQNASSAVIGALKKRATQPGYWGRNRAAELVKDIEGDDAVDNVALALMNLEDAPSCARRRRAVLDLLEYGDPRALPALRKVADDDGLFDRNRCLADDAKRAVAKLNQGAQ